MNINIQPLTESDDINLYREMTFLRFQGYLDALQTNNNPVIAFKASGSNNEPIGLGLAYSADDEALILSVFVDENHRNKGIGTLLFQKLEETLFDRNHSKIFVQYQSDNPGIGAFEKILKKQGWTIPVVDKIIFEGDRNIMKAPWIHYPLSPDFSAFPWSDLTDTERSMILYKQRKEQWYPEVLSPFQDEEIIEPLNSIGLRYKGEVAGWCINHRVAPDTIRYSFMFVRKDLQPLGWGILLLAESMRRHIKASMTDKNLIDCRSIWMVEKTNEPMIKFAEKYMRQWVSKVNEFMYSEKKI
ncbi:MAG: GNAT family N-acetyltransferase [Desulfobacterales bacterium]|nr:GNAT family N-acetyltransferase [Desulfobacterales bacterium]